jgi:uncharacterized protein
VTDKVQSSGISIKLESPEETLLVEAYGDGGFRLMGRRVEGSVFVRESGFFPFAVDELGALTVDAIDQALAPHETPEILIIGTGADMELLPKELRLHLDKNGIGYDVMSTGAAARTYNVLTIEGRNVAALLLRVL